jgi:inositol phosphorylceramide mannosyltransferase catalytic subunit
MNCLLLLLLILQWLNARALPDVPPSNVSSLPENVFGAVFFVNLGRRPDRKHIITRELTRSPTIRLIGLHRVPAYDGNAAPLHRLVMAGQMSAVAYDYSRSRRLIKGEYMTPGGLGCLMSHVRVWERVAALNRPAIVFEDDIKLLPEFDSLLPSAIAELPPNWGLLYLANLVSTPQAYAAQSNYSQLLWKLSNEYWGTYAYAIAPSAAKTLLAEVYPVLWQADSFIMACTRWFGIPVFRVKTNLVTTDNKDVRDSDVQVMSENSVAANIPRILHRLVVEDGWLQPRPNEQNYTVGWYTQMHSLSSALELSQAYCGASFNELEHMPRTMQQLIACMSLIALHGGVCLDAAYVLIRPLDDLLRNSRGFFALSQRDELLADVAGGVADLPFFRKILPVIIEKMRNNDDPQSVREFVRQLADAEVKRSLNVFVIFPAHIFDPMAVHPSSRNNVGNHPFDQHALAFKGRIPPFASIAAEWRIPRIMHFIWLGSSRMPSKKAQFMKQWMANHPEWKIMLWTDSKGLAVEPLIDKINSSPQKADVIRYQAIHDYGGVYVDLDFDNFKPLDEIIDDPNTSGFVCHENGEKQIEISVSNGLFGFAPQHPVMRRAVSLVWHAQLNTEDVNMKTGPRFFRLRAIAGDLNKLRVLPPAAFYPIGYDDRDLIQNVTCRGTTCTGQFPQSYALHHWKGRSDEEAGWSTSPIDDLTNSIALRDIRREVTVHNMAQRHTRLPEREAFYADVLGTITASLILTGLICFARAQHSSAKRRDHPRGFKAWDAAARDPISRLRTPFAYILQVSLSSVYSRVTRVGRGA